MAPPRERGCRRRRARGRSASSSEQADRRGCAAASRSSRPHGVVQVDHARSRRGRARRAGPWPRSSGSMRAVEVEVVLAEVGEHGHREPGAVDAVQLEGVRGHLHGHDRGPAVAPASARAACRSGASGVVRAPVSVPITRGAAGRRPRARQRRRWVDGGLAVGAGDPDDGDPPRRVVEEGGGQRTHRGPACRAPRPGGRRASRRRSTSTATAPRPRPRAA